MTSVCFTGHRKIDSSDMYALKSLLDSTIKETIEYIAEVYILTKRTATT